MISNQNSGSYVFTPDGGQCADTFTLNVTIQSIQTIDNNIFICFDEQNIPITPVLLSTNLSESIYSFSWFLGESKAPAPLFYFLRKEKKIRHSLFIAQE